LFTIEQIEKVHEQYGHHENISLLVSEMKKIGVTHFDYYVSDGSGVYFGPNNHRVKREPRYPSLPINQVQSKDNLRRAIFNHSQGQSDHIVFSLRAADSGVKKWTMHIQNSIITYFDKDDLVIVSEPIPKFD
jgi:uncharacterized protein YbcV (DUF1398 family)